MVPPHLCDKGGAGPAIMPSPAGGHALGQLWQGEAHGHSRRVTASERVSL